MAQVSPSDDDGVVTSTLATADREELFDLSSRYASAVDDRDFHAVAALFAPDGVLVTPHGERRGHDGIVAAMHGLDHYDRTFHLVGQIRLWQADTAVHGQTYCVAHHLTSEPGATRDMVMFLRYHDTFVRDGPWHFGRRVLDVVWAGSEDKPGG